MPSQEDGPHGNGRDTCIDMHTAHGARPQSRKEVLMLSYYVFEIDYIAVVVLGAQAFEVFGR